MKAFDFLEPKSVDEAVAMLAEHGERAKPLAGGTDLLVQMQQRTVQPDCLVWLRHLDELVGLAVDGGALRLGACATLREVEKSAAVREGWAVLSEACGTIGSVQVRNVGTIGGNVCNAAPSGDTLAPLLCLEAQAALVGPRGERTLPLTGLFTGPGTTVLERGELLRELIVPSPPNGMKAVYDKVGPRSAMDIAVVGVAVAGSEDDGRVEDVRIALAAVAPVPLRATLAEELLRGQRPELALLELAALRTMETSSPIDDVRASAGYRREMVRRVTLRCLQQVFGVGGGR